MDNKDIILPYGVFWYKVPGLAEKFAWQALRTGLFPSPPRVIIFFVKASQIGVLDQGPPALHFENSFYRNKTYCQS